MSCNKDEATPLYSNTPEALAEYDEISGGVYKGTFANSSKSGHIKIVLQNGKREVVIVFGSETRTLTSTTIDGWVPGEAMMAEFSKDDWTAQVSLGSQGEAGITLDLAGEPELGYVVIAKERSDRLVKVYEGNYSGTDSGKWNFIVQDWDPYPAHVLGFYYSVSIDQKRAYLYGDVSGNTITMHYLGTGTMNSDGNSASGNWTMDNTYPHPGSGNWSCSRTM
jgi:hypothetical protein